MHQYNATKSGLNYDDDRGKIMTNLYRNTTEVEVAGLTLNYPLK
jgi:hypothetical protein